MSGYFPLILPLMLLVGLMSFAQRSLCSPVEPGDVYKHVFELEDLEPVFSPKETLDHLKNALEYYKDKPNEIEPAKLDRMKAFVDLGEVTAVNCESKYFRQIDLLYFEAAFGINRHLGIIGAVSTLESDVHETNALDYLRLYRAKQIQLCEDLVNQWSTEAIKDIQTEMKTSELARADKSFDYNLAKLSRRLGSELKNVEDERVLVKKFKDEVGGACDLIRKKLLPVINLAQVLESEVIQKQQLNSEISYWIDGANKCKKILRNINYISEDFAEKFSKKRGGHTGIGKFFGKS